MPGLTGRPSIPGAGDQSKGCGALDTPLSRSMTAGSGTARAAYSRLLFHILDAGKIDALGAFLGVAEIEFILGQEHRIAIDVVGDAGTVGGDEGVEFLAVIGRNPARQLKFRDYEFARQRIFGIEPRLQHVELQRADHADQRRRAVARAKHLHHALLRHLLQGLFELLGLHRLGEPAAAKGPNPPSRWPTPKLRSALPK